MPISKQFKEDVGKFVRNLSDHGWYAAEIGKQVMSMMIWDTKLGKSTKIWIKSHLHRHEKDRDGRLIIGHHLADHYECEDGFDYISINSEIYRHDRNSGNFYKVESS